MSKKLNPFTMSVDKMHEFREQVRNPVKSHTLTGASRTVGREKTLVKVIVHQVCGMARYPRNFL